MDQQSETKKSSAFYISVKAKDGTGDRVFLMNIWEGKFPGVYNVTFPPSLTEEQLVTAFRAAKDKKVWIDMKAPKGKKEVKSENEGGQNENTPF